MIFYNDLFFYGQNVIVAEAEVLILYLFLFYYVNMSRLTLSEIQYLVLKIMLILSGVYI